MSFKTVEALVNSKQKPPEPTQVYIEPVDLNDYDLLLETPESLCV